MHILERNLHYNMSSFNESTGFGHFKASPTDYVKYNFNFLLYHNISMRFISIDFILILMQLSLSVA